jgi:GntR family transcriptional regulator/MocR family aminotransferase
MPRWLIGDVTRKKLFDDMGSSLLEQLALARFIDAGALGRHLRRVRPIYRRRRDTVLESLAITLPDAVPTGIAAGLHVYAQLLNRCDESSLIEARA